MLTLEDDNGIPLELNIYIPFLSLACPSLSFSFPSYFLFLLSFYFTPKIEETNIELWIVLLIIAPDLMDGWARTSRGMAP